MKNTACTLFGAFITFSLLGGCYSNAAQNPPATLPHWPSNAVALLPPVSETDRNEIRQLREIMREQSPNLSGKVSLLYIKSATRFIEFGESAGQAMVWDYLDEPEIIDPAKLGTGDLAASMAVLVSQNGQMKQDLLVMLGNDPSLVPWLLLLLRLRMATFEQAISDGRMNEIISTAEIAGIESYLYKHGEVADLEKLESIIREMVETGFQRKRYADYPSIAKQASEIAEARRIYRLQARPYYQTMITLLKSLGVEIASTGSTEKSAIAVPSAKTLFESEAADENADEKPTAIGDEAPPSTLWFVWIVVIVTAIGLLWLFLKPRK